ncbi:MAG: hypothetical protein ACRCXB_22995 [Aeromonadaceae bacterium]
MKAHKLKAGDVVKHSGEFWEVREVFPRGPITNVITTDGGLISFWGSDSVEVAK